MGDHEIDNHEKRRLKKKVVVVVVDIDHHGNLCPCPSWQGHHGGEGHTSPCLYNPCLYPRPSSCRWEEETSLCLWKEEEEEEGNLVDHGLYSRDLYHGDL